MSTTKTALQVDCPFCPARLGIACRIGKGSYTRVGGYLVHVERSKRAEAITTAEARTTTPVPATEAPEALPQLEAGLTEAESLEALKSQVTRAAQALNHSPI